MTWLSYKIDDSTFGIFDTFEHLIGREAHLNGEIAKALLGKGDELITESLDIKKGKIFSVK